jgi:hypothetical protein
MSTRTGTPQMRNPITLFVLCLLALPLPSHAGQTLGETVTAIERDLSARPEATAAGPEATQRYIAGLVAASLEVFEQSRHLDAPHFGRSAGLDGRPGLFNPDNIYRSALLAGAGRYRISGRRGSHALFTLQILDAYPIVALGKNLAVIDLDALGIRAGEDFSITLGGERGEGRWFALPASARAILARQTFSDWSTQTPSTLRIERLDSGATPIDASVAGASAADYLATASRLWNSGLYARVPVNAFPPPRPSDTSAGGLGGQQSAMARFRLDAGMVIVVTVRRSAAHYQGIQVGDPWFVTPNAIDHTASFSIAQAAVDEDGLLRFVISDTDPGAANWLDPGDTREGFVFLRWQGLPAPLAAAEVPHLDVVALSDLRVHLPPGTRWLNATERAAQRALRQSVPLRS